MRVEVDAASRRLGESFTAEQAAGFIRRMGAPVRVEGSTLVVAPLMFGELTSTTPVF